MIRNVALAFLLSVFSISTAFAAEPINRAVWQSQAVKYHDSGEYEKDITKVIDQAMVYLKSHIAMPVDQNKKLAVVLDIDDTSLSNYAFLLHLNFGGSNEQLSKMGSITGDPAIEPTLKLYQFAKANNIAVFFITGRQEADRETTIKNLNEAGFANWDGLTMRDGEFKTAPAAVYKSAYRKKLVEQGYDIVANIGDQFSDLRGGYADKNFKLPNPYYYIP